MAKITVSFTQVGQKYEAEYTGESGVLQMRHGKNAMVDVYGDAGAGYVQIALLRGDNIIRTLNMAGLDKVKIVSDAADAECVVYTF